MNILKAILLGIIQGITEFLPISSSGHLSVAQHFLKVSDNNGLLFTVLLHMGTLFAVVAVYYKTLLSLLFEAFFTVKDMVTGKFQWHEMRPTRRMLVMFVISCLPLLLLMLPVGGGNRLLDVLGGLSEDNDIFLEGFCFLLTALLLFLGVRRNRQNKHPKKQMDAPGALAVGFAQALAAGFPGISRSGSTISTGMFCGIQKDYMVRYSFVLGIPAILAANLVEFKDAIEAKEPIEWLPLLAGVITAAVVGFFAIKALEYLVKKDKFQIFAYYCLGFGALVILAGIIEKFR